MKVCSKCKAEKDESEFSKSKARKDGLYCYCRDCVREQSRKYYDKNREAVKARTAKYVADVKKTDPEKILKPKRDWYHRNKSYDSSGRKKRYKEHTEKEKAYTRRYRENNYQKAVACCRQSSKKRRETLAHSYLKELLKHRGYTAEQIETNTELLDIQKISTINHRFKQLKKQIP